MRVTRREIRGTAAAATRPMATATIVLAAARLGSRVTSAIIEVSRMLRVRGARRTQQR